MIYKPGFKTLISNNKQAVGIAGAVFGAFLTMLMLQRHDPRGCA